ncbi:MAG: hypothetical protein K2Y10_08520, partial [Burkholderiaceae bacterium]|nr:hypothetical protein [Burkholderiaceae bacterium]
MPHHPVNTSEVPGGPFGAELRAKLASHENVLAALSVDLSVDLRFATGQLLLTPQRLLAQTPGATGVQEW